MSETLITPMKRLYFKKSKNRKGTPCFIAKMKEYTQADGGRKEFVGDVIVIANTDKCKVHKSGRWDVEVKEMYKAKGYIVVNAEWTIDSLDFEIDWADYRVLLLANGQETKLKKKDEANRDKFLPLSFNAENYYPINKIADNIRAKSAFLQLSPAFNIEYFLQEFERACEAVHKEYKGTVSLPHYSIPNTPMAEALGKLKR